MGTPKVNAVALIPVWSLRYELKAIPSGMALAARRAHRALRESLGK
jgi:hypothetical protein